MKAGRKFAIVLRLRPSYHESLVRMNEQGAACRSLKPKFIASAQNATFRSLKRLLVSRGIQEQSQALIAGDKIIPEVVAHHPKRIAAWITATGAPPPPLEVPWIVLEKRLFDELNQFGAPSPLLTVTIPSMAIWSDGEPWPLGCTLFLGLQNPENLGAVVRSASAFGVSQIILLKEAAHPYHPKAMRAAGTALLTATFKRGPAINDLQVGGAPLLALDAGGSPLPAVTFPECFGLLPGVEGPGIPDHVGLDRRFSIPMSPGVESLNAATATAIALYEWRRCRP